MVNGSAVQKGLCEEYAEGRAVLLVPRIHTLLSTILYACRRKAHILIPMVAEAKVATSDRKNFPEIQYPTYHSPNKAAHESAEVIQHLDYTSVSGLWSDNKLNYICIVSRISTFYYGEHVRCDTKRKKLHNQKDREMTVTSPALLDSSSLKANEIQQENISIKMIPECVTDAVEG